MEQSSTQKMLEKVYKENAREMLNWALRKLKTTEEAEDFCHEVMSRFCKKLITREAKGEEIKQAEKYLWKTAFIVLDQYYVKSKKENELINDIKLDSELRKQVSTEETNEKSSDTEKLLEKLWKSISQLDYNLREAMIMRYLEQKSLLEISKILNVTESYVKKLLNESRNKIRENDRNHLYDTDKIYHPNYLKMSFSGEEHIYPDFTHISSSLSKQNICLACYEKACSIEDLTHSLGFPCAYIEYDLKWLVERDYMKKLRNKYLTNFFIFDGTFNTRLLNIYMERKAKCLDKIVCKLIAIQDKIKAIKFIGYEKPINHLLWFLIYNFTDLASTQTCFDEFGHRFELLHRTDGGLYYPIGIFNIESRIPNDIRFTKKYEEFKRWECNGTYSLEDGNIKIKWLDLRKVGIDLYTNLSASSPIIEIPDYKEILYKAIQSNFQIEDLTNDERYVLSQCVNKGFLSVSENGRLVSPNFYVLTPTQKQEFDNILMECYDDIKPKFCNLFKDIQKMCKGYLPKQLENYIEFITYFCLSLSHFYITGFAFYDDKLSIPHNINDFTVLTLSMISSDKLDENAHKNSYKIKLNFTGK